MTYLHAVDVDDDRPVGAPDDPWETARDGEVWRWDGARLVPASPDEVALLREIDALRLLRYWEGRARWRQRLRAFRARALCTPYVRALFTLRRDAPHPHQPRAVADLNPSGQPSLYPHSTDSGGPSSSMP